MFGLGTQTLHVATPEGVKTLLQFAQMPLCAARHRRLTDLNVTLDEWRIILLPGGAVSTLLVTRWSEKGVIHRYANELCSNLQVTTRKRLVIHYFRSSPTNLSNLSRNLNAQWA